MNDYICFLVTVVFNGGFGEITYPDTLTCAIKCKSGVVDADDLKYFRESASKERIQSVMPLHVRNAGEILKVERIFEVHEVKED